MPLLSHPNRSEMALSIRASALVFEDANSRKLLERIELVAPSELNALIIGETGTGKELVARHIHNLSGRRNGPFLAVNCGALSDSLIESELFGHEKGAFTGAQTTRQGWFEAASGGTLFLDEIGDLPLQMQVKLLRVLQEREVVRVGSHKPIAIDVRLIAATNVKLEEAVMAGRFREDLYYRLNVAALHLLPLRQRPGDILPLARYFLDFYGSRLECPTALFSPCAEKALLRHNWPGNIRELENVIHHALLIARNGRIMASELNLSALPVRSFPVPIDTPNSQAAPDHELLAQLKQTLQALCELEYPDLYANIEKIVLETAYVSSNRNQLATARLLGLSRHVMRARLLQHGLLNASEKHSNSPNPKFNKLTPYPILASFQANPSPSLNSVLAETELTGPNEDWWGF